jgi:gas vesicle protein
MKFMKGVILGGIVSAGAVVMYKEMSGKNKKQMIKKGKQFAHKLGIV